MNKKSKKYLVLFGAVFVTLMFLSSATAVTSKEQLVEEKDVAVEQNIQKKLDNSVSTVKIENGHYTNRRIDLIWPYCGFFKINPTIELESGYVKVDGEEIETPCTISINLFFGYYNIYDPIKGKMMMNGIGFGVSVY